MTTTTPEELLRQAREALAAYPYDDAHWRNKCQPVIAAIDALPSVPSGKINVLLPDGDGRAVEVLFVERLADGSANVCITVESAKLPSAPEDFHRRLEYGAALPSALNGITRLSSDRVAELFTRWIAARQQYPAPKGDPLGMNEQFLLCLDEFDRQPSAPSGEPAERTLLEQHDREQLPGYRAGYEDGRHRGYTVGHRHGLEQAAAYAAPQAAPAPQAEPMTERDQLDLARWHQRLGELADAYYEAGRTNPARQRARADLMMHALDCATGWRARSAKATQPAPTQAEHAPTVQPLSDERLNAAGLDYALADALRNTKGEWVMQDIADAFKAGVRSAEKHYGITAKG